MSGTVEREGTSLEVTPAPVPVWLPLAGCLLVAVLGAVGLTARSLWLDEALSFAATTQLRETVERTSGTMALYYILLDWWTAALGTSVAALRSLSLVFAVLTVPVSLFVFRRTLRSSEVPLAVVAVALAPALVRYGQEARSYALATLLAAGAWAVLLVAVDRERLGGAGAARRAWIVFAALSVAGVLSHGLYALQILAQGASLLLLPGRRPLLVRFATASSAAIALLAILATSGGSGIAGWVPPLSVGQVVDAASVLLGPTGLVLVPTIGLTVVGAVTLLRRHTDPHLRWKSSVPVMWGLAPPLALAVVSAARPYFMGRYLVPSLPAIAALAAVGALAVDRRIRATARATDRTRPWLAPATVVLAAALLWGQVATYQEREYDWRGPTELVGSESRPGDVLAFPHPDFALPFALAWRDLTDPPPSPPTPIMPPLPLDQMRRFVYVEWEPDVALEDRPRVWVVHQTLTSTGDQALDQLLASIEDEYRVESRRRFDGSVQVVLAVPR